MKTTGKQRSKKYRCECCGHEKMAVTNHYGDFHDRCTKCSWQSPKKPMKIWQCLEKTPQCMAKPKTCKMTKLVERL